MKTSYSAAVLILGVGLCGFSLGLIGSRPANGQIQVGAGYPFPRVSDLWNLRVDVSNWTNVTAAGGFGNLSGCGFVVSADQASRIPVCSRFLIRPSTPGFPGGAVELWQQGNDGFYRRLVYRFTSGSQDPQTAVYFELGIGIPLTPGNYVLRMPQDAQPHPALTDVALSGYWARP